MSTCKTCRFWGPNLPGKPSADDDCENVHICTCPNIHHGKSSWPEDDGPTLCVDRKTDSILEGNEAAVFDGSGYWAAFFPGPDFGCIHHSPLTPPEPPANNLGGDS